MASFYQMMRKEHGILVDKDNKPIGEKWSFDADNRKKLPKDISLPAKPKITYLHICLILRESLIRNSKTIQAAQKILGYLSPGHKR